MARFSARQIVMGRLYTTYPEFLERLFPGRKVQKITVDAGFSCPNRDGTKGLGGCIYCDVRTFSPDTGRAADSLQQKIDNGKAFFRRKYPDMTYLVYFQSYTNTHGNPESIGAIMREAMEMNDVEGIIIGTRPDCLPDEMLYILKMLNEIKPVILEIGAETFDYSTLQLINRNHTAAETIDAVRRTSAAGLSVGLHLIMGLPGEDEERMLQNVRIASSLPIDTIKFHQLQIIRNTELHRRMISNNIVSPTLFSLEDYVRLCGRIIEIVPKRIAIDRFISQAPPDMVVAPKWGIKNYQFISLLEHYIGEKTRLSSDKTPT